MFMVDDFVMYIMDGLELTGFECNIRDDYNCKCLIDIYNNYDCFEPYVGYIIIRSDDAIVNKFIGPERFLRHDFKTITIKFSDFNLSDIIKFLISCENQ